MLKKSMLALILALSGTTHATSIKIKGELDSKKPVVNIETPSYDVVAFVKPFTAEATFQKSGCGVTSDELIAKAASATVEDTRTCLFTYSSEPGVSLDGNTIGGIFQSFGLKELGYDIWYHSGSEKTPVNIDSSNVAINVLMPLTPQIVAIDNLYGSEWRTGFNPENNNRLQTWDASILSVEPRNYDQRIFTNEYGECFIPEGNTECQIDTGGVKLGVDDPDLLGTIPTNFEVNSHNRWFKNDVHTDLSGKLNNIYDYRPPVVTKYNYKHVNHELSTIKLLEIDNTVIEIENFEFLMEVSSPHRNKKGNWWHPTQASLTLSPKANSIVSSLEVDGFTLFPSVQVPATLPVTLVDNDPQMFIDNFLMNFDLNGILDGVYEPTIKVVDEFDNVFETTGQDIYLGSKPPKLRMFYNYENMSNGADVYFLEKIIAAAHNGHVGQVEVKEAWLDDHQLGFSNNEAHFKRLTENGKEFNPRQSYKLRVVAEDKAGNLVEKDMNINLMPLDFILARYPDQTYKGVQELGFYLVQSSGDRCKVYPDAQTAISRAGNGIACTFEWTVLPPGIEPDLNASYPKVKGAVSEVGVFDVGYKVYMFDKHGNMNLAKVEDKKITVLDAPAPEISLLNTDEPINGIYPVEVQGGEFGTIKIKAVNSDVVGWYTDDINDSTDRVDKRQRRDTEYLAFSLELDSAYGQLWSERKYTIKSSYKAEPGVETTKVINTKFVPSKRVRLTLNIDDEFGINTQESQVTANIGIYSREVRGLVYDSNTMGQWVIKIMAEDGDNTFVVSEGQLANSNGSTVFNVDLTNIIDGNTDLYAVAELQSEFLGYTRSLKSNIRAFRVMKGGLIDAAVRGRNVVAMPPFSSTFQYMTETREDALVLGDVIWEVSSDGGLTWTGQENTSGKTRWRMKVTDVGEWLVRAKAENRLTQVLSTTAPIKVTSYKRAETLIEGQRILLTGQTETYTMKDELGRATDDDIYEWSLDEGETWVTGQKTITLVGVEKDTILTGRLKYKDTGEDAGRSGWNQAKHRISVKSPKPPRLGARVPRLMEVGFPHRLEGLARIPYRGIKQQIIYNWILPDGTESRDEQIDFVPTESDVIDGKVNFTLQAWIDGYKSESLAVKNMSIKTWNYEFPIHSVDYRQSIKYAPSEVTVNIFKPRQYNPGVLFEYDWSFDPTKVELIYTKDRKAKFRLLKPGIHKVDLLVTDTRSNTQDISVFLEALQPEPIEFNPRVRYSNQFMRYPVDVGYRMYTKTSHRKDRVKEYDWYLNGVLQNDAGEGKYKQIMENLEVGMHEIKLEVATEYGQKGEYIQMIEVVPNNPPVCTGSMRNYASYVRIRTDCEDPDGRILAYNWIVNGVNSGTLGSSRSISYDVEDISVKVIAVDDSGDSVEVEFTIPAQP